VAVFFFVALNPETKNCHVVFFDAIKKNAVDVAQRARMEEDEQPPAKKVCSNWHSL
jgi:hypothetical protein